MILRTRFLSSRYYNERSFRVNSLEDNRYNKLTIAIRIT